MTILALDASEWQGKLDRQRFQFAYDMGVRLYIAQLWGSGPTGLGPNDHADEQLGFAKDVGMALAGYAWIPPDDTIQTESLVEASLAAAGPYRDELRFVAPDLEGGRLHPTNPVGRLMNFCEVLVKQNRNIIIYNRKNNWPIVMGTGVTEFSQWPLWEARYYLKSGFRPDTAPGIDWGWAPFGGWKQRAMLQYAGTAPVNGWSADWNVVDESRLGFDLAPAAVPIPIPPTPEPKEEGLTMEQYEELKRLVAQARADALADSKALAGKLSALEQTVNKLDKGTQRSFPRGTREYTVVPGDSLVLIAKRELGQAGRFTEIATMNYDRYPSLRANPNHIEKGWKLRLPPG